MHSYRLSEWCSNGPILEEDLALTNFALDMIGRAQGFLAYAGTAEGKGRTDDDLAYKRGEREFLNFQIIELPNGDFAHTMARILLVAAYEYYFFSELANSADATLAAVAAKTLKEVKYHLAHATDWMMRLGNGTAESKERLQRAVDELWPFTGEMFETSEAARLLQDKNIAVDNAPVRARWTAHVSNVLDEATIAIPADGYMHTGSSNGVHTEYLGHILSEMQYLQRAYPDAKW